jgi:ribonuclease HII
MEKRLKQLNSFRNISLNESERGAIRAHVAYLINTIPVKQPNRIASIFSNGIQHTIRIALSTSMLVLLVGGSVGAVADNALPGDPLYTFKINVNEQVKGMFLNTPEERIAYQKGRIENRVAEIKTLADSKSLTKEKQIAVQKAIDTHIEKISTDLDSLSTTSPSVALDITTDIEASLKENKDNLEKSIEPTTMSLMATTTPESGTTSGNTGVEDAIKAADTTLQKVADQEVKIIAKEIDSIISSVDETAPTTNPDNTATPPDEVTPVGP